MFTNKHPKLFRFLWENFFILLGLLLYAIAWNMFILPHSIVGGGLGGISAMVYYLTGLPIYVTYGSVNVILCIIAYLVLGRDFSLKSIYGIVGITVLLALVPVPDTKLIPDTLLSCIMAGIIAGTGIACYLMQGASTGGSDIIVMIISKFKNMSWGTIYVMFDACVISMSYFLPEGNLQRVAYGFVFMGVSSYTLDLIHNGMRSSVQMFIFTSRYNEIANQIIHKHHRGVTLFESIGWYTKQHRKTIYVVARRREQQAIFQTVKSIDEHAFITVSNVKSVFGMGFDALKAGFAKAKLTDADGNPIAVDAATGQPVAIDPVTGVPVATQHELTTENLIEQNRIEKQNLQQADKPNGQNGEWVREVTADSEILTDEIIARTLEKEGKASMYNPKWQTPDSEIMDVPEMPRIPKDVFTSNRTQDET
ncbi:MAG: YitT family protein [Proteobacteria bacterium]|jgi:uncharacterized membrane-anchored protein YitT (DUF2179 family)|nr:YitT family protein [Pseudomonadota bacterium]